MDCAAPLITRARVASAIKCQRLGGALAVGQCLTGLYEAIIAMREQFFRRDDWRVLMAIAFCNCRRARWFQTTTVGTQVLAT